MKKIISLTTALILLLCTAACGGAGNEEDRSSEANQTSESAPAGEQTSQAQTDETTELVPEESTGESIKALVVYFSATGNTKAVAETLAEISGADIREITPAQPYTAEDLNYSNRSSRATAEQNDTSARPAISGSIENIGDYDVIYVGYPIWWGDMPRILYTFFETYDFSGKTIAPFCTSGGSGLSGTPGDIAELETEATVTQGLHISDSSVSGAQASIRQWLSELAVS